MQTKLIFLKLFQSPFAIIKAKLRASDSFLLQTFSALETSMSPSVSAFFVNTCIWKKNHVTIERAAALESGRDGSHYDQALINCVFQSILITGLSINIF